MSIAIDHISYDDHLAHLIKMELGARAERQGFQDAKLFIDAAKPLRYSSDPFEQKRYEGGWEIGREKLRFEV